MRPRRSSAAQSSAACHKHGISLPGRNLAALGLRRLDDGGVHAVCDTVRELDAYVFEACGREPGFVFPLDSAPATQPQ